MPVGAQPYKGSKKGADGSIGGLLQMEAGKDKTEKVNVEVKSGSHVGCANAATLISDVVREKAAMGLFVSLAEPTHENGERSCHGRDTRKPI